MPVTKTIYITETQGLSRLLAKSAPFCSRKIGHRRIAIQELRPLAGFKILWFQRANTHLSIVKFGGREWGTR